VVSLVSKSVHRWIVLDKQVVPAAIAVLGGDEMVESGRRHRLMSGDQPWMARLWVNASPSPKTPVAVA